MLTRVSGHPPESSPLPVGFEHYEWLSHEGCPLKVTFGPCSASSAEVTLKESLRTPDTISRDRSVVCVTPIVELMLYLSLQNRLTSDLSFHPVPQILYSNEKCLADGKKTQVLDY